MSEESKTQIKVEGIIQLFRKTMKEWTEDTTVIEAGEPALLLDEKGNTVEIRIGNGKNRFIELPSQNPPADQTYNPERENAQSGKAVAEAIIDKVTVYEGTDIAPPFTNGKIFVFDGTDGDISGEINIVRLPYKIGDIYVNPEAERSLQCVAIAELEDGINCYTFVEISGGGGSTEAVLYTKQTLTPEQQAQARANVDAVGTNDIFETVPNSNLLDETTIKIGLLNTDGNIYTGGSYDTYAYYEQYIPVSEGEEITLQYDRGSARIWSKNTGNAEYRLSRVIAYDKDKTVLPSLGATHTGSATLYSYIVPTNVAYIRVSLNNVRPDFYTNNALLKNAKSIIPYEPYEETYAIKKSLLPESDTDNKVLAYLPAEICVAVGRTIEIYNNQVCPNADKYHFRWNCNVGKALKRKFSIAGTESLVGNYTLTLEIYDDELNVVWNGTTALKITSKTLANETSICTIGDSLTNNKFWLNELRTLSANKIVHVGTRGITDGLKHEGRSGFSASAYLKATTYTFENEGVHPFWDAANSCFSWNYYKTNSGINPTAVQLFLGTNDLAADSISEEDFVTNMKTIVNAIRTADSTIPIFVVHTICWGNQNGIGVQTSSDGFASQKGRFKYALDYKIIKAAELLYDALKGYTNLYFVPLTQCHDSEYNFGAVETPVNPRATQTEYIPNEGVHPQKQGYEQIADIMYSVICDKLGE